MHLRCFWSGHPNGIRLLFTVAESRDLLAIAEGQRGTNRRGVARRGLPGAGGPWLRSRETAAIGRVVARPIRFPSTFARIRRTLCASEGGAKMELATRDALRGANGLSDEGFREPAGSSSDSRKSARDETGNRKTRPDQGLVEGTSQAPEEANRS